MRVVLVAQQRVDVVRRGRGHGRGHRGGRWEPSGRAVGCGRSGVGLVYTLFLLFLKNRQIGTVLDVDPGEEARTEPEMLHDGELLQHLDRIHLQEALADLGPAGHCDGDVVQDGRVLFKGPHFHLVDEVYPLAVEVRVLVLADQRLVQHISGLQRGLRIEQLPLRRAQDVDQVEVVVEPPHAMRPSGLERVREDQPPHDRVVLAEQQKHVGAPQVREQPQQVQGRNGGHERELVARAVVQPRGRPKAVAQVVLQLGNHGMVLCGQHLPEPLGQVRIQLVVPLTARQVAVPSGARQRRGVVDQLRKPVQHRHEPVDHGDRRGRGVRVRVRTVRHQGGVLVQMVLDSVDGQRGLEVLRGLRVEDALHGRGEGGVRPVDVIQGHAGVVVVVVVSLLSVSVLLLFIILFFFFLSSSSGESFKKRL